MQLTAETHLVKLLPTSIVSNNNQHVEFLQIIKSIVLKCIRASG